MNKRQKRKRIKIGSTAKQRRKNRLLCERYPFLIPRNEWTDKLIWDKDIRKYSITLADDFEVGWWKAFGKMMCEELREELIKCNYLNEFRFTQIKEKYGGLRAYHNGVPEKCEVDEIIDKYSHLSENICLYCGKPDVPVLSDGWITPCCYECYAKVQKRTNRYYQKIGKPNYIRSDEEIRVKYDEFSSKDKEMANSYTVRHFSTSGSWDETIDVSETANKIRANWKG